MKSRIYPDQEPQALFLLSLVSSLEIFISGTVTLLISTDPKNALIFGYSPRRLLLVVGIMFVAVVVLAAGLIARRKKVGLNAVWLVNKSKYLRQPIYFFSYALIVFGWLSLFCPPYLFGRLIFIFERLQPLLIALGICFAQSWLYYLFVRGRLEFRLPLRSVYKKYSRPVFLFITIMILPALFIAFTKFGLLASLTYSNVPGIPLTGLQFLCVLTLTVLWISLVRSRRKVSGFVKKYYLIPILVFLAAILVWGLTPLKSNYFSVTPSAPDYQPFPYSDARLYDEGGITILQGYGIQSDGILYFKNVDKPLYRIFLAGLHLIAGPNYILITWLQIIVLALIPVILFFLGEKFYNTSLGIFASLVMIIQQRNAIVLSKQVSSINPKLFMTEEMTLLGVVLVVYLVFVWMRDRKIWQAILCGGTIGVISLIRFNVIPILLAVTVLITAAFWKMQKKILVRHLAGYFIAFLILVTPWLITSINYAGTPWLLVKFQQIFNGRYENTSHSQVGNLELNHPPLELAAANFTGDSLQANPKVGDYLPAYGHPEPSVPNLNLSVGEIYIDDNSGIITRFVYHVIHNFTTTFMSLPDSIRYDDLIHLSQRIYWIDNGGWQGDLPGMQTALIFMNILLVAVGLGFAWVHHRWAGLLPLVCYGAYIASLGAAMNSGGRYIVPIDWVIYFYYGLAIVAISQFVVNVLTGKESTLPTQAGLNGTRGISDRKRLVITLLGIFISASLIPFANYVLPLLTASTRDHINPVISQNIVMPENSGIEMVAGEILYPYYSKDLLTFTLFTRNGFIDVKVDHPPQGLFGLTDEEDAVVVLQNEDQNKLNLGVIYTWENNASVPIIGAVIQRP